MIKFYYILSYLKKNKRHDGFKKNINTISMLFLLQISSIFAQDKSRDVDMQTKSSV